MTRTRVNEIDALRLLAALLVVFFHYTFRGYAADGLSVMPYPLLAPFSKYGYLGVELFFIISGFVILMTAANGSLNRFIVSRVVRLYPAFWACCTITFLLTLAFGGPRFTATASQYFANLTMLSAFAGVDSIDGAYWSLFVELRFYALIAVVLALGRIRQAQGFLTLWLVASMALEIYPIGKLRFILLVDYSAYFIAGAAYFLIWSRGMSWARSALIVLSWALALVQALNGLSQFENNFRTPLNGYVVGGVITAFFVVMLLVSLKRTGFWGRRRWIAAGVLTYPLYLLHQNIGYMVFNIGYPRVNPHLLLWGTLFGVIVLAYAVHALVEKKLSQQIQNGLDATFNATSRVTLPLRGRVKAER